jgi:hypothetical protein
MHWPCRATGGQRHRARRHRAGVAQHLGRRIRLGQIDEPLGMRAKQIDLVDRLWRADIAQLVRTVGGEHQQRNARVERLDHSGHKVRRRRARGTNQHDRLTQRFR